ncbi:MAG: NosD domain-containing protein [Candidatus Bathyarchaeia archaeon]
MEQHFYDRIKFKIKKEKMSLKCLVHEMMLVLILLTLYVAFKPLTAANYISYIDEIIVNEGESIQAAVDAAPVNSIIRVMPGKYPEQLRINKSIKLIGSGNNTIIQGFGTSTCIKIIRGTTGVVLANFCIDGAGSYKSIGVFVEQSSQNKLLNLTVRNFHKGLRIYDSVNNVLRNVHLLNNTYNLEVYGLYLSHFIHDIDTSNTVNGKKIYYLVNTNNAVLRGDAGYVAIINSTNALVTDLSLSDNFSGLLLAYTNNTIIHSVNCTRNIQGIRLVNSHNITVSGSSFLHNDWSGISLEPATTCKIYSNIFKFNQHAIYFSYAPYIFKVKTTGNKVFLNEIINNTVGLYIDEGCGNEIYNNNFVGNKIAVEIGNASGNKFFGNNFLVNNEDVNFIIPTSSFNVTNSWDNGYPDAGNYWSKHNSTDDYKGLFQNVSGSDGVVDKPFLIGYGNVDRYPLLGPTTTFLGFQFDIKSLFVISGNFSEILDFNFNPTACPCVTFKLKANYGKTFCRIGIPQSLLWAEDDHWKVFLNESCVNFESYKGINYAFLYFQISNMENNDAPYTCEVKILGTTVISEINPDFIFMLFVIITILFIIVKRSWKRFEHKKVAVIFFFFSTLLLHFGEIGAIGFSSNNLLIVGENGFKTIGEAIRAASDGDKIIVKGGIYREQLIINKTLMLYGEGLEKTIIETDRTSDTVIIVANNVSLRGFTVRNFGGLAYSNGIRLINASYCLIEENLVEGKFIGIRLENGSCKNTIKNNVLKNNHYGMFFMRRSSENIIFNNSILDSGWNGIELAWYSNNNIFEANSIINSGAYGIEIPIYSPSYGNIIFHNNFMNNSLNNPLGKHASDFFNNSWFFNGEGNYWDDYTDMEDRDKDGIGDFWYYINEERKIYDIFPLMGNFHCYNFFNETISIISSSKVKFLNVTLFYDSLICIDVYLFEGKPNGFLRLQSSPKFLTDISQLTSNGIFSFKVWSSSNNNYIYVEYPGDYNLIRICGITEIPEFNSKGLFHVFFAILTVIIYFYAIVLKFRVKV